MPDGSSLPEIKISQLPVGTQANLTDQLEASQQSGSTYVTASITVGQVATAVAGTLPAPPDLSTYAKLASPLFTGDPQAPTPATADNDTSIATTAYVKNQGYALSATLGNYLPLAGGSMAAAAAIGWTARSQITSPADGNFVLRNNAGASFGTLQFGGTTNAFPGLLRNGTALSVVLADGSNLATLNANNFNVANGLFYGAFGSITSPGVDGQFTFYNNAGTAGTRLDITTDGTIKFRNRTNTADAIATAATQPGTQNDNSLATTAFVKTALPTNLPPNGAAGGMLNGTYPNPGIAPSSTNGQVMTTVSGVAAWAAASGAGKLLQTVNIETGAVATGTTLIPYDDTIPQQTEGDQYMTLAITPQSATSKLIIEVVWFGAYTSASAAFSVALFQDATANALAAGFGFASAASAPMSISFRHSMTSGTTSATTFKVRAGGSGGGTATFNGTGGSRFFGGVMASSITIQEVLP